MDAVHATRRPGGPLAPVVAELWFSRGQVLRSETVAASAAAVGALVLGAPIVLTLPANRQDEPPPRFRATSSYLLGPHDLPVTLAARGEVSCLGVVTTPVGCAAALHVPPAAIRGRAVNLLAAWPGAARVRREAERLTAPEDLLDALEHALLEHLAPTGPRVERCAQAVALLERDPTTPVADVASAVGISPGHLDREFARFVGLSPRTFAGIVRVRTLLEGIEAYPGPEWSAQAARLGWTDARRLSRDVQRLTGSAPAEHAAARGADRPGG